MQFVALGPVAVVAQGHHHHSLPRAQSCGLLAYLLLNAGQALAPLVH